MARFNPDIPTKQEPNYLGYSKEPDKLQPNTSLEKLFSGVGSLFDQGVGGADTILKQKAEKDTEETIDKEMSRFTSITPENAKFLGTQEVKANRVGNQSNNSAIEAAGSSGSDNPLDANAEASSEDMRQAYEWKNPLEVVNEPLSILPPAQEQKIPAGIDKGIEQINMTQKALESGEFSSTYYHQRLVDAVSGLRARWPGYRDVIDQKVSQITGVNPANSLINDVIRDLKLAQSTQNSGANQWMTYTKQNSQYLVTPDGNDTKLKEAYAAVSDPDKQREIIKHIGQQKSYELNMKVASEELSYKEKKGHADEADYIKGYESIVRNGVQKIWDAGNFGAFGSRDALQNYIRESQQTGKVDPVKTEAGKAGVAQMRAAAEQFMFQVENDPQFRSKYGSVVDRTKIDKIKADLLGTFDLIGNQLGQGKWTMASTISDLNKMVVDQSTLSNLATPAVQKIRGIIEATGNNAASGIFLQQIYNQDLLPGGGKLIPEVYQGLSKIRTTEILADGSGSLYTSLERSKQYAPQYDTPPIPYVKGEIDKLKSIIVDPNANTEWKVNAVKVLSHPDSTKAFMSFDKNQRMVLWGMAADEKVTKAVKQLGGESWNNYNRFMESNFQTLYQDFAANMKDAPKNMNLNWDAKSGQVQFSPRDKSEQQYQQSITNLNNGLKAISNVDKENGRDTNAALIQRVINLYPNENLPSQLIKSMQKSLPQQEGKEGQKTEEPKAMKFSPEEQQSTQKTKNQLPEAITRGLHPNFKEKLERMMKDAPGKVDIYSGYRTVERQRQLFDAEVKKRGSIEEARKYVAPPGKSQHNFGAAADLNFQSPEVQKWIHQNASKYGLNFRMSHEKWHIEPQRADGGRVGGGSYQQGGYTPSNTRMATGNENDDGAIDAIVSTAHRINPQNWDKMIKETPPSDNVDDQRQDNDEEQVTRDYGLYLLKKKMTEEPAKEATKITVNKSPKKETKKDKDKKNGK